MKAFKLFGIGALAASLAMGSAAVSAGADEKKAAPKKASASKKATKAASGDATAGEEVFNANCKVCHFADKTDKRIGPGLKDYYKKAKMENGKPVNDATTKEIILEGEGKMIPFKEKLDEKQVTDLIAYLKTL